MVEAIQYASTIFVFRREWTPPFVLYQEI